MSWKGYPEEAPDLLAEAEEYEHRKQMDIDRQYEKLYSMMGELLEAGICYMKDGIVFVKGIEEPLSQYDVEELYYGSFT